MISFFKNCWSGRERLWRVWWLLLVPFNVLMGMAERNRLLEGIESSQPLLMGLIGVGLLAAKVILTVMIWRCAPNVKRPMWRKLARFSVVVSWLFLLLNVLAPHLFVNGQ